ncbi:PREDICTED: uncharacterized protein LOC109227982 [Nicotiana attenuata]|uniref:uncharacterized protein LOC109227850 n=1 Tax=Nicotiana attenuata TaxID=49451 RepID=UPI0009056EE0|nr:PREDICTED: uncharacterized protein LOC109227850 [Nicotiana attenuata]XP_019248715.1 PREDICTED: uncharacterized protein LOC109227982 [Nicotiana attenuata]
MDFSLGMENGILRYKGRLCVPNVDGLRERIMTEAYTSRYSVHPSSTKMYHDLKEVYWWNDIKMNIADFVERCSNCQQVKAEHERPAGLAQNIEIPLWKWEMINMDFVVGLSHTPRKFDLIWVNLSTPFHPQTEGQAEKTIETLEDILRACVLDFKCFPHEGIMQFGKKGKLSPRLELPPEMSLVHLVFHVSMLKKVVGYLSLIVPVETIEVNEDFTYEEIPVGILDRQVRKLRNKEIASVKAAHPSHNQHEKILDGDFATRPVQPSFGGPFRGPLCRLLTYLRSTV